MSMAELAGALKKCERVMIVAHVSPDGDALGSALALRRGLISLGKQAAVTCQDAPPRMYAFLPDVGTVVPPGRLPFEPDCALFVDVAAPDRAGSALQIADRVKTRLVLDHHGTNGGFGDVCVIRGEASSTGELALELLDELGVPLDAELAALIYVAVATDTGNFSFSNTTPQALRAVARCLEAGLNIGEYSRRLFRTRSLPRTRMIGQGLSHMELAAGGRIAFIRLTRQMFEQCGALHEDTEGLVNYLNEAEGVEVCFVAEENGAETKVSLRSNGRVDVAEIARSMGGGGHGRAAGATIGLPLDGAALKVLDALQRALNGGV